MPRSAGLDKPFRCICGRPGDDLCLKSASLWGLISITDSNCASPRVYPSGKRATFVKTIAQ
jgi:hypothetical protein